MNLTCLEHILQKSNDSNGKMDGNFGEGGSSIDGRRFPSRSFEDVSDPFNDAELDKYTAIDILRNGSTSGNTPKA
jgi:hypothetical protein